MSAVNIGEIELRLAPEMGFTPAELAADEELRELGGQHLIPMQDVLVELPDTKVLVDAGRYDVAAGSPYAVAGYTPPLGLVETLSALGVAPEAIDHVVVTHRHWDHFNALAVQARGAWAPTFPRARHHLGAADWASAQQLLEDPDSRDSRHLGTIHAAGQLDLVDGERELVEGVTVIPAPGETPGHQIVRVRSGGETLFVIGDLYHHPVELPRPRRMVRWADPAGNLASRKWLMTEAVEAKARIVASHIPSIGRLRRRAGESVDWVPIG